MPRSTHRDDPRRSRSAISKLTSTGSDVANEAAGATAIEEQTHDALYQRAAALGISGRSRMTNAALAEAIRRREAEDAGASKHP